MVIIVCVHAAAGPFMKEVNPSWILSDLP